MAKLKNKQTNKQQLGEISSVTRVGSGLENCKRALLHYRISLGRKHSQDKSAARMCSVCVMEMGIRMGMCLCERAGKCQSAEPALANNNKQLCPQRLSKEAKISNPKC